MKLNNPMFCNKSLTIVLIAANLLITGCATTMDFHPTIVRAESPEVSGSFFDGDLNLQTGPASTQRYATFHREIGGDIRTNNSTTSRPTLINTNLNARLGILKYVDIKARLSNKAPNTIGGKIQIYGANRRETGFKVAFAGELGLENKYDDSVGRNSSALTVKNDGRVKGNTYDISLIMGYRPTPEWIFYLNNFYSVYDLDGTLEGYSVSGRIKGFGHLLGARHNISSPKNGKKSNNDKYVSFEIGTTSLNWLNTKLTSPNAVQNNAGLKSDLVSFGISIGRYFK